MFFQTVRFSPFFLLRQDRKKAAVQNEDYDAAKALKSEIDRLRSAIDRPPERPMERLERPQSGRSQMP